MRAWSVSAPSCLGIRPFWPDVLTCIHGTETRYGGDCRHVLGAAMLPICCKKSGLTLGAPSLPAANLRLRKSYPSESESDHPYELHHQHRIAFPSARIFPLRLKHCDLKYSVNQPLCVTPSCRPPLSGHDCRVCWRRRLRPGHRELRKGVRKGGREWERERAGGREGGREGGRDSRRANRWEEGK